MKIQYKTGDALKGPEAYTCHGCNSRGVMGSGIALQVKTDYPEAFNDYRVAFDNRADKAGGLELGRTIWVTCRDGRTIINAITQADFGRDKSVVYASYDGIRQAIRNINDRAKMIKRDGGKIDAVAFPTIGAGLANGSWKTISAIIEEEATEFQPVVYLFDGKMPEG
jgi:O-acetyl-ADP-ribose deacetylase (regulator of RNase III)